MYVYVCVLFREGNGNPLQYSWLEDPMDRGAWWDAVHGVSTSRTRLSDFTFTFHCHALEKEMATHSSVLAWKFPGTGEPGGLLSMGSYRVGHDWRNLKAACFSYYHASILSSGFYIMVIQMRKFEVPSLFVLCFGPVVSLQTSCKLCGHDGCDFLAHHCIPGV